MNQLILGDNLAVMERLLTSWHGAIDLIYIDPPFATNNVFRSAPDRAATVSASLDSQVAYSDTFDLDNYLEFLRPRIELGRELLSDRGSFYVHTDTKVGHYVKVMLDGIFGRSNFRSDITRIKSNPKNFKRRAYGNIKDAIFFYTKGPDYIWNEARVAQAESTIHERYNKVDAHGRRYTTTPLHAPGETRNGATGTEWRGMLPPSGRHWRYPPAKLEALDSQGLIEWSSTGNPRKKIYADEARSTGVKMQDVWEFKDPPAPTYPTQKNLHMLRKIVAASSDESSIVMDFFCGSGTALKAAEELCREWLGIDESQVAVSAAKARLGDADFAFVDARSSVDDAFMFTNPLAETVRLCDDD